MTNIEMIRTYGHERVCYFNNEKAGLKAIIALHNTNLGPAVGGCRLWPYESEEAALFDVLRLSRGMSHKNAAAGLPLGGAKGVIIAHPSEKTEAMFEAFGEAVNTFNGKYYTAEDVNTDTKDADYILRTTDYVVGRENVSGDPSPFTAIGVYDGMRAVAKFMNGSDSLDGLSIAIQGLGKVGIDLAERLSKAGAKLFVCNNTDRKQMKYAVEELGATEVPKEEIYDVECDIFAPCALGAIVNKNTIPRFKCRAIAGAANNVIYDDAAGEALKERGILYAPDFIINGGGVINAGQEAFTTYDNDKVLEQVHGIYDTVYKMLEISQATGRPEGVVATEFAENRIKNGLDAPELKEHYIVRA
ncbi:MAG: Glu/Leu/Phe/Val dehydrogenase [Mogibacterium sp.]|nr:Glu/Leu/Phe/Val dehydrogenase [Mogibacterium sp.]